MVVVDDGAGDAAEWCTHAKQAMMRWILADAMCHLLTARLEQSCDLDGPGLDGKYHCWPMRVSATTGCAR